MKARPPGGVDDIPKIKEPPDPVPYSNHTRDPFDPSVLGGYQPPNPNPEPRPMHAGLPEYLEGYPLDTLRMVGTMNRQNTQYVLIKTPDGTVQPVTKGNYLGQNQGKITHISESGIELTEIVSDGRGHWIKHKAKVALSE